MITLYFCCPLCYIILYVWIFLFVFYFWYFWYVIAIDYFN